MTGLSYAHGPSSGPLLAETIGACLDRVAAAAPGRAALVDVEAGRRWTYAELRADADAVARGLVAAGVSPGDRVGLWSTNRGEWVVVQHAAARAGAILVNLNPAFGGEEIAYVLEHAGVKLLFAQPRFRGTPTDGTVAAATTGATALEQTIRFDDPSWDALLAAGASVDDDALTTAAGMFDFDDPVSIQYTSGTTGTPKGATLTHHNLLNNALAGSRRLGITHDDRVCVPVPLFHVFGTVYGSLATLVHAACQVLPSASFDPAAVLRAVEQERCTVLYGVPTMFIAELEHQSREPHDVTSLRTGLMAGAPCPVDVAQRTRDTLHMSSLQIGYGMTETSPCSLQTAEDDEPERRITSVGRVLPDVEVKIVDPATGKAVPRGARGELCTRGYLVMQGYWRDPIRTAEAVDEHRWMHTGDLATMDDDGYVNIVGRIKDIVIRGGENIDVREIEELLHRHEDVAEAHVVGVPDERLGEELVAWVRCEAGRELDEEAVRAWCAEHLARFKVPRYVRFTPSFPMTASGKVQKFKLRDAAIADLGLTSVASVVTA